MRTRASRGGTEPLPPLRGRVLGQPDEIPDVGPPPLLVFAVLAFLLLTFAAWAQAYGGA